MGATHMTSFFAALPKVASPTPSECEVEDAEPVATPTSTRRVILTSTPADGIGDVAEGAAVWDAHMRCVVCGLRPPPVATLCSIHDLYFKGID